MRKWILRWLGIDRRFFADALRQSSPELVDNITDCVRDVARAEVNDQLDAMRRYLRGEIPDFTRYGEANRAGSAIVKLVDEKLCHLECERFIDSVVERINRKQVRGKR